MSGSKSHAIYQDLLSRMEGGRLEPGTRLPAEKALAKDYGVALLTVRRALARLRREGRVESRPYHGTVVCEPRAAEGVLALLVPQSLSALAHPVFSRFVDGIEGALAESGYMLEVIVSAPGNPVAEAHLARSVTASQAKGWLIPTSLSERSLAILKTRKEPKIVFHSRSKGLSGYHFGVTMDQVAARIAEHLAREGYRKICFIGPVEQGSLPTLLEELIGEPGFCRQESTDCSPEEGRRVAREILAAHPEVDAWICADDELCVGVREALGEAGRGIPQNALIGGGDFPLGVMTDPPLSTIAYPHYQIGGEATRFLLELIGGACHPEGERLYEPRFVPRGSSCHGGKTRALAVEKG